MNELHQTDYPVYALGVTSSGLLVLAGGGGQGNYGVPNQIELLAMIASEGRPICSYQDPRGAFNNIAVHPTRDVVAAGINGTLHLFNLRLGNNLDASMDAKSTLISETSPTIIPTNQQLTDFHDEDQVQNVVRFSGDGSRIATGGADGNIRLWSYPSLKLVQTMRGHSNDVLDLDFNTSGSRVVSVDNGSSALVWRTVDATKETELNWYPSASLDADQYVFRAVRFLSNSNRTKNVLISLMNPLKPTGRNPSYLLAWDTDTWKEIKRLQIGSQPGSTLAVCDNGIFIGVGHMDGTVTLVSYPDFTVQRSYKPHALFVTALTFVSDEQACFSLVSASADRAIIRTPTTTPTGSKDLIFLFIGLFILVIVFIMFLVNDSPEHHATTEF